MSEAIQCHCGSQRAYKTCCLPYLSRERRATSAEALMRSRYTAFCTGNSQYLLDTWSPAQRVKHSLTELADSCTNTRWRSLRVIACRAGRDGDTEGEVEFVAFHGNDDDISQLHERSRFCCKEGHWYYIDGEFLPPLKLGRNDACWCGSGKKLKKCHPE